MSKVQFIDSDFFHQGLAAIAENRQAVQRLIDPNTGRPFRYHNVTHTFEDVMPVYEVITDYGIQEGLIYPEEKHEGRIAISGHDRDYTTGDFGNNEARSAKDNIDMLNRTEYNKFNGDRASYVGELIICTSVVIDDGRIIQQVKEGDYISEAIDDADLSSFGREFPIYLDRAIRYLLETIELVDDPEERIEECIKFFESNVKILESHRWHRAESGLILPHTLENRDILQDKLKHGRAELVQFALAT